MTEDEEYEVKASLEEKLDDLAEQSDDFYVPIKDRIIGVLCIVGGGYVIQSGGTVNAGYAVVPMSFCLCCSVLLQSISRKK